MTCDRDFLHIFSDVRLMLTGLRAMAGHLQPQPRLRAA